MRYSAEK